MQHRKSCRCVMIGRQTKKLEIVQKKLRGQNYPHMLPLWLALCLRSLPSWQKRGIVEPIKCRLESDNCSHIFLSIYIALYCFLANLATWNVCVCVLMPTHCTITCFGFHARWIDGVKCGLFSNHAPLGQITLRVGWVSV